MNFDIKHLSEHITPSTAGIIWLTDNELDIKSPGVYEFNYLLNGMLLKSISKRTNQSHSHFLLGENFGKPLFIGHCVLKSKSDLAPTMKSIDSFFDVAKNFLQDDNTIYIFNKSKNTANTNILKELSRKYSRFEFKILNI